MLGKGCCFPCIHILTIVDLLQYNNHEVLQDEGAACMKSHRSHSKIHDFPDLTWKTAASQQSQYHQVTIPA